MSRLDESGDLNRSALIDLIYTLQTDLRIIADRLAREPASDVPDRALLSMAVFQDHLYRSMPSLNRH